MADLQAHTQRWRHHRAPTFARVDDDTATLLDFIADDPDYTRFLRLCKLAADQNDGMVSVQAVRALVAAYGVDITPRRYSAFWSRACAKGGPMVTTTQWDICDDRKGKNSGKPQRLRRWVGEAP